MKKVLRPYILLILIIGVSLLLWSFQNKPKPKKKLDTATQVRMAVDEKLANRKAKQMDNCRETALNKAEEMVDSMLMAQAKLTFADTINKPPKPPKPELIDVKTAKDNTPIGPLFIEDAIETQATKIKQFETKTIKQ